MEGVVGIEFGMRRDSDVEGEVVGVGNGGEKEAGGGSGKVSVGTGGRVVPGKEWIGDTGEFECGLDTAGRQGNWGVMQEK